MPSAYDHNKKAGNEGDVVKHVALVAALSHVIGAHSGKAPFRYCDLFAGYAYNPLVLGNEWTRGLKVAHANRAKFTNAHVRMWLDWYAPARPDLLGSAYPGSALIARDVHQALSSAARFSTSLWDISPAAVETLRAVFSEGPTNHAHAFSASVFLPGVLATMLARASSRRVAVTTLPPDALDVLRASFLFVDPPGLQSASSRRLPAWASVRELLAFARASNKSCMAWLPVSADTTTKTSSAVAQSWRRDALTDQMHTTEVWWKTGTQQGMMGCLLVYALPLAAIVALRDEVDPTLRTMGTGS